MKKEKHAYKYRFQSLFPPLLSMVTRSHSYISDLRDWHSESSLPVGPSTETVETSGCNRRVSSIKFNHRVYMLYY